MLGVGLHCGSVRLTFSDLLGLPASGLHGSFCDPHVSAAAFIPSDSLGLFCAPLEHRGTCECSCLMLRALGKSRGFLESIVHMGPGQAGRRPTAPPEVGAYVVQLLPEGFGGSSHSPALKSSDVEGVLLVLPNPRVSPQGCSAMVPPHV